MEIKSAEFVISNTDVRKCPEGNKPEYAFTKKSVARQVNGEAIQI